MTSRIACSASKETLKSVFVARPEPEIALELSDFATDANDSCGTRGALIVSGSANGATPTGNTLANEASAEPGTATNPTGCCQVWFVNGDEPC